MKKIIVLLLSVIFCIPTAMTYNGNCMIYDSQKTEDAIGLFAKLGVAENVSEQQLEKPVTRKEFAELLNSLINGKSAYSQHDYFLDARKNTAINNLAMQGFIKGKEENKFFPDDETNAEEICKTLVRVCGAEVYAQALGGNKAAYISAARDMNLYDDALYGAEMTYKNVLMILYKACRAKTAEISSIENGNTNYSTDSGETLLERYRKIYYVTGIMTANRHTYLSRKRASFADKAEIDGTEYKNTDRSYDKYIGTSVVAYYHEEDGNTPEIVYMNTDSGKTAAMKIDAGDVISFEGNTLKYKDKSDKTKTANFPKGFAVIYNGLAAEGDFEKLFDITTGSVTLYENSGEYTAASIESYTVAKVRLKDESIMQVYTDRLDDFKVLEFDNVGRDIHLYSANSGLGFGATQLMVGDTISVMRSQDGRVMNVYLCDIKVSGVADSIDDDCISVDGKEYEFGEQFEKTKISVGENVDLRLDLFGKVVACVRNIKDSLETGYVYKIGEKDGTENEVELKIFTVDGTHEVFKLKQKLIFNKERIDSEKAPKLLSDKKGNIIRQVIRYAANGKNEIGEICTAAAYGTETEENEFRELTDGTEYCYYIFLMHMFYPKYLLSGDTVTFIVPKSTEECTEDNMTVVKNTGRGKPFYSEDSYVRCFKYDDSTPFVNVVLNTRASTDIIDSLMPLVLIKNVRKELGDGGEEINVIDGYSNYLPITLYAASACDVSGLGSGDVIQYITNGKAEIQRYNHIYDCDKDVWSGFTGYGGEGTNFHKEYIDGVYTDPGDSSNIILALSYNDKIVEYSFVTPSTQFMVYEKATNKIRTMTTTEIAGEKNSGGQEKYLLFSNQGFRVIYR